MRRVYPGTDGSLSKRGAISFALEVNAEETAKFKAATEKTIEREESAPVRVWYSWRIGIVFSTQTGREKTSVL